MPEGKVSLANRICKHCGSFEYAHFSGRCALLGPNAPLHTTFEPTPAADAGPRQMRDHTSDCCLDLDHKGDCKRWMKLPPNSAYPQFKEVHVQDDWCSKAGCRPASQCEIDAYNGHAIAPPVPQEAAPKQWKRGASGHYAEHLSTHTNPPEECSACKAIEAQMTVNNLPQGAVGVPQEAAPKEARRPILNYICPCCGEEYAVGVKCDLCNPVVEPEATAPDGAMRVAQEVMDFYFTGTSPEKPFNAENVAALIREAGSERERGLHAQLRQAIKAVRDKRGGGKFGRDDDGWWDLGDELEQAVETVLASRLLGGESK